jgi:hypothetical protein
MEKESSGRRLKPDLIVAEVCAALNRTESRYLVIGGIACILHGYVRATTDIDILIDPTRENVQRVLSALAETGYGFAREWSPDEILKRPITVIGDDPAVDIFTVAWSVKYRQAAARSSIVEVQGVPIPLIHIDDLIATKRTGRVVDALDIEALEEIKRIRGK